MPLIISVACTVSTLAGTLAYFRPTIERLLQDVGGHVPAGRVQSETRRWIRLNWIRMALAAVSWWGALTALATHG